MDKLDLENMLVDHYIGNLPAVSKPVSYIMQGDGLWEIRKNSIGIFRKRVAKIHIPGLTSNMWQGVELTVPKIPIDLFWKSIAFFRKVYDIYGTESAVRVIYDKKAKRYFLDCPTQEVSSVSCSFDREKNFPNGIVVAELHSHGSFAAAFSPTDDKDEVADRFYGIVGKVSEFFPQVCFRASVGGKWLTIKVEDLFDLESDPMVQAKFPSKWMDSVKLQEQITDLDLFEKDFEGLEEIKGLRVTWPKKSKP